MRLGASKPGQYRSKCKNCGKAFAVKLSDDPSVAPTIQKLKPKPSSGGEPKTAAPVPTETIVQKDATIAARDGKTQKRSKKKKQSQSEPIPEKLGGFQIIDRLGQGAMGAVYRARQVSLDREVALKTILARLTNDPRMIARFTREAYAAAQITHHNVVQIYDLGVDGETHFFAMEYVRGQPLSNIVKTSGRLDSEIAVSYILQAARGLQAAHGHGMVHRDVKPANLLVSDDGVVKVADLGLVKVANVDDITLENTEIGSLDSARADITLANVAMGTAAFMAPEQSENAATVDHRADIYALGCTLYSMITGQMPFEGTTALEVISKHRTQPIQRPDAVVKNVPQGLSDIVMRMVTKDPGDRYDNMGQVVAELEKFLGVSELGGFSPSEEHAETMLNSVNSFNNSPAAKLRAAVAYGFPVGCAAVGFATLFFNPFLGASQLGIGIVTVLAYFIISGLRDRTDLFSAVRELVSRSSWTDRLTWFGGLLVVLAIAWATNILLGFIVVVAISVGIAFAFHAFFDAKAKAERAESLQIVEDMLRSMRLRGVQEENLRNFVAKYSGDKWEEFYEALFGYRAKLNMRRDIERGEVGRRRKRFRSWRDPLFNMVDSRLQEFQDRDEEEHLQRVERNQLEAEGVAAADATEQAKKIAAEMVRQALETRTIEMEQKLAIIDPDIAAEQKRRRIKQMLADAKNSKPKPESVQQQMSSLANRVAGSRVRFVVGCLLMTGCLLWIRQNNLFSPEALQAATEEAMQSGDVTKIDLDEVTDALNTSEEAPRTALKLPVIGGLFDNFQAGIAGLILAVSAFVSGFRMSFFAVPAAIVTVFGPALGLPGIAAIGGPTTTATVIGLGLLIAGFVLVQPER
jgi:serine/threonine protein kinase